MKSRNIIAILRGVRPSEVIQIGNITIEILPKADRQKSTEADKNNWHNVLLKMLKKCKKIRVDSVSEAALKKRYHSLLDLYFELYLKAMRQMGTPTNLIDALVYDTGDADGSSTYDDAGGGAEADVGGDVDAGAGTDAGVGAEVENDGESGRGRD